MGFFLVINGLWNLAHCKIWRTSKLSCHCWMMLERVWLKDDRSDNASGRPAHRLARQCRTDNNSLPPRFRRRQNMYFCTKAYVDCWYFTNLEYLDILLGVTKHRIGCIAEFCTTSGLFRHQSSPATTSSLFRSKMTCRLSIKTETIPSSSKQTNNASSRLPPYLSSAALLQYFSDVAQNSLMIYWVYHVQRYPGIPSLWSINTICIVDCSICKLYWTTVELIGNWYFFEICMQWELWQVLGQGHLVVIFLSQKQHLKGMDSILRCLHW